MNNSDSVLKILVVSDLHAVAVDNDGEDSHLKESEEGNSDFFIGFLRYIDNLKFSAGLIVCPGDVANQAGGNNFNFGWKCLNELKERINAKDLICVPGNHDHDSRYTENRFDPKYMLQSATPKFPSLDWEKNTHFWAWHWCHNKYKNFNVILLNSSAYHGMGKNEETEHGRISPMVSSQIIDLVKSDEFKAKSLNILVCHHHPSPMKTPGSKDEHMQGAENLFEDLLCTTKGAWIVIHGHRHLSAIKYAQCSISAKQVYLSAGSLGAKLDPNYFDDTLNQFHCVTINLKKTERIGAPVGLVETHTWTVGSGWTRSSLKNAPAKGGFGSSETPLLLANKIKDALNEDNPFLREEELKGLLSEYKYFTPDDRNIFFSKLNEFKIFAEIVDDEIIEIGLITNND